MGLRFLPDPRRGRHGWLPAALLGALAGCSGEEAGPRPSTPVILISLDTWRADRLRFDGRTSPTLQRLAAESVVFEDCLANSSNTGPSHRSLFTGQYVHRHDHRLGHYVRSPTSLAGELKDAGYETVAFTGGGFLHPLLGFAEGFDRFETRNPNQVAGKSRRGFRGILPQTLKWWRGRRDGEGADGPFFLFLHTYDIHCPYWPGEPWRAEWEGGYQGPLDLRTLCGREAFDRFFAEREPTGEDLAYLNRMYDGGVAMTDDLLGGFLDELESEGVLDDALLIVTSDHGESLGEHRWVGHNHVWEEQLRVPLLIRFPGGRYGGTRSRAPAQLIDILPTILDELGLEVPAGVQGESLLPWLEGERSAGEERLRIAQFGPLTAVRTDSRYKLVIEEGAAGARELRLFDLREDPREQIDLAQSAAGRPVLRRLQDAWTGFRTRTQEADARFRGVEIRDAIRGGLGQDLQQLGYADY